MTSDSPTTAGRATSRPRVLPPVMGLHEIAAYFAVTRQRADKWADAKNFPKPLATLAQGRVWRTTHIFAWAKATGRYAGCGPRQRTRS